VTTAGRGAFTASLLALAVAGAACSSTAVPSTTTAPPTTLVSVPPTPAAHGGVSLKVFCSADAQLSREITKLENGSSFTTTMKHDDQVATIDANEYGAPFSSEYVTFANQLTAGNISAIHATLSKIGGQCLTMGGFS
jgi:hypothetical protein